MCQPIVIDITQNVFSCNIYALYFYLIKLKRYIFRSFRGFLKKIIAVVLLPQKHGGTQFLYQLKSSITRGAVCENATNVF